MNRMRTPKGQHLKEKKKRRYSSYTKSTNLFHLVIKTAVVAEVVLNALAEHFCLATPSFDEFCNNVRLADSLHGVYDH